MGDGTSWNEIPVNPNSTPQQKMEEFDAQVAENQKNPPPPAIVVEVRK